MLVTFILLLQVVVQGSLLRAATTKNDNNADIYQGWSDEMIDEEVHSLMLKGESFQSFSLQSYKNKRRKLIKDADRNKVCFQNSNSADFYLDPFKANDDRGDWGKCLPEELFGVMCEHEAPHLLNDGSWTVNDGPLHDKPSEELYKRLKILHDDYCVHMDLNIDVQTQSIFNDFLHGRGMYTAVNATSGQEITLLDSTLNVKVFPVVEGGKKYFFEGSRQPIFTFLKGVTYTFDQSDPSNLFHRIRFTTNGEIAGGRLATEYLKGVQFSSAAAGTPGAYTKITVPSDAPTSLYYICENHVGMGATFNVQDVTMTMGNRKLISETGLISYQAACIQKYPSNPRYQFQMSLYCLTAYFDKKADLYVKQEYKINKPCEIMMRSGNANNIVNTNSKPPLDFCKQDNNTCTVLAPVWPYTGRTCSKYCAGFPGLKCVGASTKIDGCLAGRNLSCDAEQTFTSSLLCTCGIDDSIAIKSSVPSTPLTTTCTAMLASGAARPQVCQQDFTRNRCQATVYTNGKTCNDYCTGIDSSFMCYAGYNDQDDTCNVSEEYGCNRTATLQICTCGPKPNAAVRAVTPLEISINNPNCERMAISNRLSTGSGRDPDQFCPSNTLIADTSSEISTTDVCTTRANLGAGLKYSTCSAYCSSFPSMKCAQAAALLGTTGCVPKANLVGCNDVIKGNALCGCTFDAAKTATELSKAAEPISKACINLAFAGDMSPYGIREFCSSDTTSTSCSVMVTDLIGLNPNRVRSCDAVCGSYEGMKCTSASETPNRICNDINVGAKVIDCSTPTLLNNLQCTCGFVTNSTRLSSLNTGPVYTAKNTDSMCPAYKTDATGAVINEADRTYKKITLNLEKDISAIGAVKIKDVAIVNDFSDSNIDSYNTNDVEVCAGVEFTKTVNDKPETCSFGHRLSSSSNCYGKLQMDFDSARQACAKREGNLLRIDDAAEVRTLNQLFGIDRAFSIGLYENAGLGYEWDIDGKTGLKVQLSSLTYLKIIPPTSSLHDCFEYLNGTLTPHRCTDTKLWICEGKPANGGDLKADEGGFCLWYLDDPTLTLPDDESAGFRNTVLGDHLAYSVGTTSTRYHYYPEYDSIYPATIDPHPQNEANWDKLTYSKIGVAKNGLIIDKIHEKDSFHCHFSPTNFGTSRIYLQQHMLERLYPGSFKKHCFCGYKNIGYFVSRCDCTRNGVQNNNCQKHHRALLYNATYKETGRYVYCNTGQCDIESP